MSLSGSGESRGKEKQTEFLVLLHWSVVRSVFGEDSPSPGKTVGWGSRI